MLGALLICYSRFDVAKRNITILRNSGVPCQVYLDAPKTDLIRVKQDHFVNEIKYIVERIHRVDQNKGVRNFIPYSINSAFSSYEELIILEDDICINKSSIDFVIQNILFLQTGIISLFNPLQGDVNLVIKDGGIWGWACSKRVWNNFKPSDKLSLSFGYIIKYSGFLKGLYFYPSIIKSNKGLSKSWAYAWLGYRLENNINSLLPARSLSKNIGINDPYAENTKRPHAFSEIEIAQDFSEISVEGRISLKNHTGFPYPELVLRIIHLWLGYRRH